MNDFLPNVRCPHCNTPTVVAISGFGAELSIRVKVCTKCHNAFYVKIFTQATKEKEISDGDRRVVIDRIKWLREERRKAYAELLVSSELYRKLYEESLERAREMRNKADMN